MGEDSVGGRIRPQQRTGFEAWCNVRRRRSPSLGSTTFPRCWGGLIYYNPSDPRIEVPNAFGWGFTLNLARRTAWLIVGIPLGIAAFILAVFHLAT